MKKNVLIIDWLLIIIFILIIVSKFINLMRNQSFLKCGLTLKIDRKNHDNSKPIFWFFKILTYYIYKLFPFARL